ncbi:SurA N-terminal domain-containing protein [Bernardetia sp. Wsw4-3y2]|uniref:peptidylprolyl isomerase n=1 Tax=Bernardetia sp. Wsw4-3y2 TaxID=3127471 RepID=UPI0030D47C19
MSIITAIQKRTGLLLVVILGALAAFVLTDLIGNAGRMGSDQVIGEIDGTEIKYQDFNNQLQIMRDRMEAANQNKLNESQMPMVRTQTWNELVTQYALKPEWEKLGIMVTQEEVIDMVQGNNISPQIKQAFTDPETGVFDKDKVIAFIRNLQNQSPQAQQQFAVFEQQLPESRRSEKYENLLRKSVYVTTAEAKRRYEDETTKLDLKFLYVPYANIADSTVNVTPDQIQEYYNNHKEDYDDAASVAVEYIAIPIAPSKADSMEVKRYLSDIKNKFASAQNDTSFVAINSQIETNFAELSKSNLPEAIKKEMGEEVTIGMVSEPTIVKGVYTMFKVVKEVGQVVDSVKANHILFSTQGKSPEEKLAIETKAKEVLAQAKNGGNFSALAKEYSEDKSNSEKGGELDWFGRNAMVKPFEDATFGATQTGILPELVETNYGYHIIDVKDLKRTNKYLVASVGRLLEPSQSTRETLYRQAGDLASSKNITEYEERTKQYNLLSLQANDVKQNARSLNNIYDPSIRQAIRWAFEENTSIGDISNEVFEVDNQYIVMTLKSRTKKGIQPLSKVYEQVRRKVLEEAKKKEILAKLKDKTGTLEEIATAFGEQARVLSQPNYTYITTTLNGVGFAPKAVGMAFGMKEGETSKPIADETGIVIMKVEKYNNAGEVADYAKYKEPLVQDRQQVFNTNGILRAIKQLTDTEENIDSFY